MFGVSTTPVAKFVSPEGSITMVSVVGSAFALDEVAANRCLPELNGPFAGAVAVSLE